MSTTHFSASATRLDPYKNFKFRLKWDGRVVAGVSKVSTLKRTTEVVTHREGGDASSSAVRRSPGQSEFEPITLERGVTHDVAFQQWANKVWDNKNLAAGQARAGSVESLASSPDSRKDLTLEVYNEAGEQVQAYNLHRCWVSEYQALPELDATGDAVAIQHIKLENEGWEQLTAAQQPTSATTRSS